MNGVRDSLSSTAVEIQKADSRARRKASILLFVGTLVGATVVYTLERRRSVIEDWLVRHQELVIELPWLVAGVLGVLALPVLGGAIWLWRFGQRISMAERYPPPGVVVVRDTRVERGAAAVRRGRRLCLLAAGLALTAVALPICVGWLVTHLVRGA